MLGGGRQAVSACNWLLRHGFYCQRRGIIHRFQALIKPSLGCILGVRPRFLVGRHPYAAADAWGCVSYQKFRADPILDTPLTWPFECDMLTEK
jgi:hypothetical protein